MKRALSALIVIVIISMVSCSRRGATTPQDYAMQSGIDSVSYALGMNMGLNLIEMDSLLNVDVVCQAIRDVYAGQQKLNDDEARYAFLKYMNFDVYERTKAIETQFLVDLRKSDRKFVATNSGLTYKILTLGDVKSSPRGSRDTVVLNYTISNVAGQQLDTTYNTKRELRHALGKLPKGLQEAVRLIGPGGHMMVWIPSALAYSSAGLDSIGVKPNQMLFYDLRLNKVITR